MSWNSSYTDRHRAIQRRRQTERTLFGAGIALLVVLGIAGVFGYYAAWANTKATQTCTVTETDRTQKAKGGSDMRVYTKDCGVFAVSDDMIQGQWNSADTFSQIEAGKTYNFETVGWRNGFFSTFPNIISVAEVQ